MIKTRPFLKWAGNKYGCLEHLLNAFPQRAQRLIEPFAGSAAVFLNTDYPAYLLAEENRDLINLFGHLQADGPKFIAYCRRWFVAKNNTAAAYYHWRQEFNRMRVSRKKSAIFLYLNRHGYNGLCRYNASGAYNVPFGRYLRPYFPQHELTVFHQKSQGITLMQNDFRKTFLLAQKGDIIYCDPPYAPLHQTSNFSAYTGKKFVEEDQRALADCALAAANRGIMVMISNHDTAFTRAQYQDADISSFQVKRMINCKTNQRIPAQELLAIFRP